MHDDQLQGYQDDLDTTKHDAIMSEEGENPAKELGIPEEALKEELDKLALDETRRGQEDEDEREAIEDMDEHDDNAASGA